MRQLPDVPGVALGRISMVGPEGPAIDEGARDMHPYITQQIMESRQRERLAEAELARRAARPHAHRPKHRSAVKEGHGVFRRRTA